MIKFVNLQLLKFWCWVLGIILFVILVFLYMGVFNVCFVENFNDKLLFVFISFIVVIDCFVFILSKCIGEYVFW